MFLQSAKHISQNIFRAPFFLAAILVSVLYLSALSMSSQAYAIDLPKPDFNDPEIQQKMDEVEAYFQKLSTMEARFIQANPDGNFLEGSMFMHRPGRMRFAYDPPTPFLLVADGSFFIHVDKQLEQVTYIPLGSTPAALLLGENMSLRDGLTLSGYYRANGLLRMKLHDTEEPELGSIILTFTENPLALKQWSVEDAQQNNTTVTLIAPSFGGELDPELFKFRNPWQKGPQDK